MNIFLIKKNFYIAMEYIEGENLQTLISKQKNQIEESTLISYLSQIVSVLIALQKRSLIHRDLKATNIFLTPDGN